jgi:hypothetical protein
LPQICEVLARRKDGKRNTSETNNKKHSKAPGSLLLPAL